MKDSIHRRANPSRNWGGRRPGAGRKPKGEKAMAPHVKRAPHAPEHPLFVTMRLAPGARSLRANPIHACLRGVFVAASRAEFRVLEYSLQDDHLHLLVEAEDERALARGMIGLAVRMLRGLHRRWRRPGPVFADRYRMRTLRTPAEVRSALVHLLLDGRRHGTWTAPEPDVHSSGPAFDGWRTAGGERRARELPPARTRLLASGWRRLGLIDPREVGPKAAPGREMPRSGAAPAEGRASHGYLRR
jgi:REP-associated tyrosine transposase